jgi:molybdate transport system substrate-binding protein
MCKKMIKYSIWVLLLYVGLSNTIAKADTAITPSLTVMADQSMTVPVTLIARNYALSHNVSVSTIFGATKTQIHAIEEGADANVLISAKTSWVAKLQQKGLMDVYSRRNIASNKLVLVGSEFEFRAMDLERDKDIHDFTKNPDDFIFAIGDPVYAAEGSYTMEALETHDLQATLEPHYNFFRSMFQLIRAVSRYQSMGVVFHTDALLFPEIKELQMFKQESHTPIIYQAVVIAGDDMALGREFLNYLTSDKAARIFKSFGFTPVT